MQNLYPGSGSPSTFCVSVLILSRIEIGDSIFTAQQIVCFGCDPRSANAKLKLSIRENHEFTMKRSNTWRDVDDFDFGHEEDEEEFMKVDAYAAKTKQGKRVQQEQQQRITSNRRGVAKNGGGRRKLVDDTMDWIARHRPTRASQLAVNQKKVEEFAEWARGLQVGIWLKNLAGKS